MKKILSIIIIITFLTSNLAYGYPECRDLWGKTSGSRRIAQTVCYIRDDNRGVSEPAQKYHLRNIQAKQAKGTGEEIASAMAGGTAPTGADGEVARAGGKALTAKEVIDYCISRHVKAVEASQRRLSRLKTRGAPNEIQAEKLILSERRRALVRIRKNIETLRGNMMDENDVDEFVGALKQVKGGAFQQLSSAQRYALEVVRSEIERHPDIHFDPDHILFVLRSSWIYDLFLCKRWPGWYEILMSDDHEPVCIIFIASVSDVVLLISRLLHEVTHTRFINGQYFVSQNAPEECGLFRLLNEGMSEILSLEMLVHICNNDENVKKRIIPKIENAQRRIDISMGMDISIEDLPREEYKPYFYQSRFLQCLIDYMGDDAEDKIIRFLTTGDSGQLQEFFGRSVWDKILNVITNQFFINVVSDTEVNQIVHYTGIWLLIFLFRSNLPKDKLEVGLSVLEEILNTMSRQPYSKIYLGASESGKEISKFTWAGMAYKVAEGLIEEALQQETPVDFDKMRRKLYRRTKREAEKLLSAAAAGEPARAGGKETIPTYEVGITVARGSALGAGEANLAGEVQFVPLTKEFVQGHYEELMDAEQSPQMEREGYWDQARFLEDMRASTKTLLEGKWELSEAAVDENGRVIGYLIGIYGNDDCPFAKGGLFVFRLAVHRDHRRRHIASVLLHRFAQKALESGISKVSLETWQENKAAQEVYENAGFKKIGERYDGKKGMNFYQYTADAQALFDAASSSVLPPAKANLAGEASASADAKGFGQHISLEAREAIWRRTGYRIVRWLGFGSESIFYEVVDSAGGHFALGINYERRNVYAEKIKKQLADDRHPAIPAIYKTGRLTGIRYDLTKDNFVISGDSSLTYQVYELRRGVSLDKFPKKKLTPEIAAAIISGTIEGLDFLFRHGFSHPDFVEDNIVVEISADGQIRVYLSDFVPNGPRDLQVGIGKNILSWRRISNSVLVSSRLSKELRRQARPIIDRIKKLFLEWDEDSMAKAKPDLVALRHIISASAAGASANLAGEGNQAASVRGEMLDSLKDNYWISYWHSVFRKLAESDPENTITAVITFDRGAGQSKEFRIAIPDPAILNNVTQKKYIFRYLSVYINNRAVSWGTENIGVEFEGTDFGEEYFGLLYDELSNSGILRQINETANYGRSVIIKHGHVQSSRLQPQQKAASTAAYDFSKGRTIGVDIGGTNIKIGTLDKGRFAPYGKPVPTQLGQAPEIIVGQAVELIKQAIGEGSVDAVCVASPSLVTEEGEIVKCSLFEEAGKWSDEQKRYWQGLREHMEKALGVPVVVVEDGYSAICSVLYGKAVENYKDIGYVGGGKGLTARVLKSGGNYEIPLSECGRVIVDLSPLAPAHTSTGVTGVAQQIFSSQAMYRFLKNRGIKIPEYSAYDPDLLQIGTFIDNELIEGNESVIAAINDMTGGLGFVLLELSDIFENYTWILGGGVVSGQTGQLLGHFLRKNPLLYHITTIFNISADVEPGYVGTFGATHIANRFAQIQAASANLAGDLSAEAHTSYDEYRAKAEARAEGAQDVTEEAKEILTVALDDDSPALASLLSIMERLGVRVIEGTIPREVAQGARWADGEIGRAEIISDVKMEQGYPVRIDSATIYCGSRLSSLELMHELVEFEFVEMLMQDNQRGNHLSAENIQQLINLRLNDLMVWLHLICRWRYYKLGHRAIFICAKGAYREGEKIFANAGDRAGQIMDILKKTSFAAEVLTYLEDFDAIVTDCEPVLKAMSENLPIDQVEVKHYILSAVVEFLDKINALAVADPSWFLSDGRHRGEAGVGRLLLGAVELRHNIHALAAVVIDEKAAADEKRKDMEEQIKMRWGFDAVAIVADGAAAEQKKQELEGKYPGIRFLRIQRLDEGFAFGIIDMAGLDMIKLQAQINEAIREYLKSV